MFVYNNVTSPSIHPSSHASLALLGAYETIPKPVCSESVQGLLIVRYVWKTSPRRCPGCIQIRCPQHCDGVLSLWKSSNSTRVPPRPNVWSLRLSFYTLQRNLFSTICFHSHSVHHHPDNLTTGEGGIISTDRLTALFSCSARSATQQTGTASSSLMTVLIHLSVSCSILPSFMNKTPRYLHKIFICLG